VEQLSSPSDDFQTIFLTKEGTEVEDIAQALKAKSRG
jgi:hypothetical protein